MRLPKSVQEIADVIGNELALFLVGQLPRCVIRDKRYPNAKTTHVILYVPTAGRLAPDHQLVRLLGWHQAVRLCQHFGGEILHPANCADVYRQFRDRSIVRMVRTDGMDPALVAEFMDVSRRHVSNLLRENPQQDQTAANDNDRELITTEKLRAKF
jgi:hypothetical protein